jgi:hypothetical protein
MTIEAPKINALIGLIADYRPSELIALQKRYPQYVDVLKRGTQLGQIDPEERVWIDVALSGLRVAIERAEPNLNRLRRRLFLAKNIRLGGSIVAAITSAGLVIAIANKTGGVTALLTAVVTFLSTLFPLFSSYLEASDYGGKKNLVDLCEALIKNSVEAEQIEAELEVYRKTNESNEDIMALVKRANGIAAELSFAERSLWGKALQAKYK